MSQHRTTTPPASATRERKLAAILSADVAGYSRLMSADEAATLDTLAAHRAVTDPLITQHRGRIVNTGGDSILAEFAGAVDAVQCAVAMQQALAPRNAVLPPDRKMEFRIGLNVGDVLVAGEDLFGDGVNVAARLQALADPGGVFISGTVYDQVKNKLALSYEDLGLQTVKNIAEPVRTYRVLLDESEKQKPVLSPSATLRINSVEGATGKSRRPARSSDALSAPSGGGRTVAHYGSSCRGSLLSFSEAQDSALRQRQRRAALHQSE